MFEEKSCRANFEKQLTHFREEISRIRTGRAHSAMVENLSVESYGTVLPLLQLASISIPDARTIVITPWDSATGKDIEKAIVLANIGAQPVVDGAAVRLTLPSLTEENRKELVKLLGGRTEKARVGIRVLRDQIKESIVSAHKDKALTDDDKFLHLKKLDELTREFSDRVDKMSAGKEKEILSLS